MVFAESRGGFTARITFEGTCSSWSHGGNVMVELEGTRKLIESNGPTTLGANQKLNQINSLGITFLPKKEDFILLQKLIFPFQAPQEAKASAGSPDPVPAGGSRMNSCHS